MKAGGKYKNIAQLVKSLGQQGQKKIDQIKETHDLVYIGYSIQDYISFTFGKTTIASLQENDAWWRKNIKNEGDDPFDSHEQKFIYIVPNNCTDNLLDTLSTQKDIFDVIHSIQDSTNQTLKKVLDDEFRKKNIIPNLNSIEKILIQLLKQTIDGFPGVTPIENFLEQNLSKN